MAKNLKIIRFLGGEEIMAEILEHNKEVVKVKNPIRIVVMPSKTDPKNPQVGFAPYLEFSADKEISLNATLVVTMYNPVKEFVSEYTSMFSGIMTAGGLMGAGGQQGGMPGGMPGGMGPGGFQGF